MKRSKLVLLLLSIGPMMSCAAMADEINIAVASNFSAPMQKIVARFSEQSGHKVSMSFGSSGKFYAQITHGAPFALFFSADEQKPQALVDDGLAVASSEFTYAIGRLALWSVKPDLIDGQGSALEQGGFEHLALANPKTAPYGKAAMEVLAALGLQDLVQEKIVTGENIAQAYQFAYTGNADLGLVALSQIIDFETGDIKLGSAWIVPQTLHSAIRQNAVILKAAADKPAAIQLWEFVQNEESRAIISAFGYSVPESKL